MRNNKVLIIGLTWPEPKATAAGTRMMQLIDFFLDHQFLVTFGTAAAKGHLSFDFENMAVSPLEIELNSSSFDKQVKDLNPSIVIFDRFLSEEQYGWRVKEACPNAIRILDTEDLHFLRKARKMACQQAKKDLNGFLRNDVAKREVASIYRSDLSLIISNEEIKLLTEQFKIPPALLLYLPFLPEYVSPEGHGNLPTFELRKNFMTIGNFKHGPNLDALEYLHRDIWPLIRQDLPGAELHVYGAYPNQTIQQWHNKKTGFLVKGWIEDKREAFTAARLCLAPLRYGAGLKGKLLDAMQYGTPSVTTQIGAEGMAEKNMWNGFITDNALDFASASVKLYKDKDLWEKARQNGYEILSKHFDKGKFAKAFSLRINDLYVSLKTHRSENFIGSMLDYHTMNSTKYLSKWIEAKNLANNDIVDQQPPATNE